MLMHFVVLGILASVIFSFRIAIPILQETGDQMHDWFKLVPTYMVGSAMFCDKSC